jgi:hypothetical protein
MNVPRTTSRAVLPLQISSNQPLFGTSGFAAAQGLLPLAEQGVASQSQLP